MEEFRVANCLTDNRIKEFAIFKDGSKKQIIKNDDGYKYFYVDNYLSIYKRYIIKTSFFNRIKDAIQTIRDGNGDLVSVVGSVQPKFGLYYYDAYVYYFLDRKYGEDMRKNTLKDWENSEFISAIEWYSTNAYAQGHILNTDLEEIMYYTNNKTIMKFDSDNAAEEFMKDLINKGFELSKESMEKYLSSGNVKKYKNIIGIMYDIMKEKFKASPCSILTNIACDLWKEDLTGMKFDKPQLVHYNYNIIQFLKR